MENNKTKNEEKTTPPEQIHWNKENPTKLDMEYHNGIGFVYKAVLVGSILAIIINMTLLFVQAGMPGGWSMILLLLPTLLLEIIGLLGALGIPKRKPNSIFLCKVFVWTYAIYEAINLFSSIATGEFPNIFLIALFFCCLYILFYSILLMT